MLDRVIAMEQSKTSSNIVVWGVLLGCVLFALQPALTRSHVEGFSYLTETMSMLVPDVGSSDPLWRIGAEFYYITRPGVVWAMAPLSSISPGNGYNLLMWLAMPVFLLGLVFAAQAWSRASWIACAAVLLFLPIVIEANFFTNDNLLAMGLTLCAMTLLLRSDRLMWIGVAGALSCLALLCRLDQILLIPLLFMMAALKAPTLRAAVARVAALTSGFVLVTVAFWFVDPIAANPFLRIEMAAAGDGFWQRDQKQLHELVVRDAKVAVLAVGTGLPAIALGLFFLLRQTKLQAVEFTDPWGKTAHWALALLIILYPVVMYIPTVGKYYDARGVMTLMPMFATLAALGLEHAIVRPIYRSKPKGIVRSLSAFVLAVGVVLPVALPAIQPPFERESAPTVLFGRIWHGHEWLLWQSWFRSGEAVAARVIYVVQNSEEPMIAVSWSWTQDRQFQNTLVRHGFMPISTNEPECKNVAEAYSNTEGEVIHHLRLHVPFMPEPSYTSAALFLVSGEACLASFAPDRRLSLWSGLSWANPVLSQDPGTNGWYELSDTAIEVLRQRAAGYLLESDPGNHDKHGSPDAMASRVVAEAEGLLNAR